MHRGTRAVLAAVVVLAALSVADVHAGTPWDACPDAVNHYPDHVRLQTPRFRSGQPIVTSLVADPRDPSRLAVSNDSDVQVSDDAGCTWKPGFVELRPGEQGTASVVAHEGTHVRVFVVGRQLTVAGMGAIPLRVFARDDGVESAYDLPPEMTASECSAVRRCFARFGSAKGLAVGYVASPGVFGNRARLGVTTDGGRTWTLRDMPVAATDLAVDPKDDARVAILAGGVPLTSQNRGETWTAGTAPRQMTNNARVAFTGDGRSDLVIVDASTDATSNSAVFASRDDGATFVLGVPVAAAPLHDLAMAPTTGGPALVVAAGSRLFRQAPEGGFDPVIGQGSVLRQVAPTTTGVWVQRAGAVAFVDTVTDRSSPTSKRRVPRPGGGSPAGNLRARAGGGRLHVDEIVQVPPGGTGATIVTGDLGRQPRGLDVFFLMDTSSSMTAKIAPMANAMGKVVDALNREGIAARFGLGEHGDSSFRYRRHADLGTPPEEVRAKMTTLTPTGGLEYHYTAFYQIATGDGHQSRGYGGSVPPGQQASFEPGTLHVIVHATDEPDNTDPEGPSEATALAALRNIDVHHIGIHPYDGAPRDASNDSTTQSLKRYAAGTSTFAPIGGLDCDGDGKVDIHEGEPIACAIPGSTSADAPIATLLERVLLSLSALQPVTVESGPTPLGVEVTPLGDYRAVDMHEPNRGLQYRVSVTCPAELMGSDVEVPLELVVGGVAVATAPLRVTCLAAPEVAPPTTVPDPSQRPAPRLVPAVPPLATSPPALAPSTATAQAASSASQGASQSVQATQVGMAVAPDEAAEVARATEDEEMRFVAAAFSMAFALLYAARPSVATDWRDRWRR